MTKDISYRDSYGYKLAEQRNAIGLTQGQFAESVNAHLQVGVRMAQRAQVKRIINTALVHEWEANKTVPTDAVLEAISEIVTSRGGYCYRPEDAESIKQELRQAALRTRQAIAAGILRAGESSFGDLLHEKLKATGWTEAKFANEVANEVANRVAERLEETLVTGGSPVQQPEERYDFDYIYRVEHGLTEPSETFKAAAQVILSSTAKKYSEVIAYLATEGEDALRRTSECGDATRGEMKKGILGSRGFRALKRSIAYFKMNGIVDESGVFLKGPNEGEEYHAVIAREYDRQKGRRR